MDFIKSEMQKEFNAVGFKNQRRNLKASSHQTGKSDKGRDETRHALLPGKRISKSGNKYYENRSNRSDKRNSKL